MISTITGLLPAPPRLMPTSKAEAPPRAPKTPDATEGAGDAPALQPASQKAQARDLAYKRLERVKARMDALKLMIKIDPRTALKLAGEIACEMKAAVKAYAEAGGRNVSAGDLALIRRQAADAIAARDASAEAGLDTTGMDSQIKALEAREADAFSDHAFFDEVRQIVRGLKKAREDVRSESIQSIHPPTEEDWKRADRDQAELEREIDRAASGPAVSIRA
ncbi:hypothetical protein [Brevundimonas sp. A19_0]|uniref:hypothetical protein n=1 Tax=Brevundimonas sp. A19_0 TaxID=2821087 RepID=UPI001ADA148D|nr:hypothetical protein [Brevundimonas sp. A19_0]MBO9501452.1 hypothetical protein [Brevundimonas sp. A19_0]